MGRSVTYGGKLGQNGTQAAAASLLRATLRISGTGWALISGLTGLVLSAGVLIAGSLQSRLFAALRRAVADPPV
jgi:hypothetical protein